MLSRVADNLYWMSRYLERAEHTSRLVDVNLTLMLDEMGESSERRWKRVLTALAYKGEDLALADGYQAARELAFSRENAASVTWCISSARENARQVREQISSSQWQRLNRLYLEVTRMESLGTEEANLSDFFQSVQDGIHLFQGVTASTMSHGEGWNFIRMGRYIERAQASVTMLKVFQRDFGASPEKATESTEYLEWIGLLRSLGSFEGYCTTYTADVHQDRVMEFLLLNPEFPHSVRYAVDSLRNAIEAVQGEGRSRRGAALSRVAGRLQSSLSYGQISEIMARSVQDYLESILRQCHEIHELIYEIYVHYSIESALVG
jgi:uncharacterized alpha-E superfamily protein